MGLPVYLYVTPFFPSADSWRGAYCYDFVRALVRTGAYEVRVFRPGDGSSYEYHGVTVHTFRMRQLPSNVLPFLFAGSNARSFVGVVEAVADREGWSWDDVAVCHGNTATFCPYPVAAKHRNPKCLTLLHHHDLGSFGLQNGILRHCWLYNLIEFPILRHWHEKMDLHVFISEMNRKSFLAAPDASWTHYADYRKQMRGLPWSPAKIKSSYVLYNGVDTATFRSAERKLEHEGFVIGCIGNFNPSKGQMVLLKAVARLGEKKVIDGLKVRMVGSGPCLKDCKQFVAANGLEDIVSFEPEVRHEMLPEFYRALDLFVLPSAWDGFGCVYTEAWACGTPFIMTEGAGVKELVDEPEKWVAKIDDADDLAAKIGAYCDNRWVQKLTCPIDVDGLVARFCRERLQRS